MVTSPKGYVAGGLEGFRYEVAPLGQKVLLLTRGGVCVEGRWYGAYGQHFWGWAPLPPRDREIEARLGLQTPQP
jgi:hypothetical protein